MDILSANLQEHSPAWCNAPWSLIPKTLNRVSMFQYQVSMVVPFHEHAAWRLLCTRLVQRQIMLREVQFRLPDGTIVSTANLWSAAFFLGLSVLPRSHRAERQKFGVNETGTSTFQRYNRAWCNLMQVVVQRKLVADPLSFQQWEAIRMYSLAAAVASFASQYSPCEAKNLYSALTLFPCFQSLPFEKSLAGWKTRWNASRPRYAMFYDV